MPFDILCDENLPRKVGPSLEQLGHDVKQVTKGQTDDEIASQAKADGRTILTFDSDFANILAYPPVNYTGIIFLKIEPPSIQLILNALENITNHFPHTKDLHGKLIVAEPHRFRVWD